MTDDTANTVEMSEERHDNLKASLKEAEEKAERVDDLEASLQKAEDEREDLEEELEALSPVTDAIRAALQERSENAGIDGAVFEDMSAARMVESVDDIEDLFASPDESEAGEGADGEEGEEGEGIGSSGDGEAQTGAGEADLDTETQEEVAALKARAETAREMGWEPAAEEVDERVANLTQGGN